MTTKITSFDQLTKRTQTLQIIHPVTGEVFEVEFKELTQPEVNAFLYETPKPTAPIKNMVKNQLTGRVEPEYDFDNIDFQKKLAKWNDRFVYRWIVESWVVEIPGETVEEKIKSVDENLPGWVINRFRERLEEIGGLKESDIAFAKKKSLMMDDGDLS